MKVEHGEYNCFWPSAFDDKARLIEALVKNAQEGIGLVDPTENFIFVNPALAGMLGYEANELVGMNLSELTNNEEFSKFQKETKLRRRGESSRYEAVMYSKNGDPRYFSISASPFFGHDGQFKGTIGVVMDLTERKRAEKALKKTEQKYRSLYESIKDGVAMSGMKGHILECNQSYLDMLGYTADEIKKLSYLQITPTKWHGMERELIRVQVLKRGYSDEYEKEYIKKDGTIFPVSVRVWLMKDEHGVPVGMWGIIRDITERKRIQDEIKSAKDYIDNIIKSMIDALIVVDPNAKIKTLNIAALEVLGYREDELIGKPVSMILEEETAPFKSTRFKKLLKRGFITNSEMIWKAKSGGRIPVNFSGRAIRGRDGKLVGIVGVARDMREKKKATKLLEFYREYAENIVGHLPVSLILVNRDLFINFANQHFLSKMHMTKENVAGKELAKVLGNSVVENFALNEKIMKVIKGEETRIEGRFILKSKTYDYMIVPIKEQTGRRLNALLVMEDVTKNVMMEEQLIHSEKLSAVGTFTASVVHEINNPLSIVVGNIQYLLANLHHMNLTKKKEVGEIAETLKTANAEARRCSEIVTNLLHFSHKGRSEKTKISVNGVVTSTMRLLTHQLELSKVKTQIKLADGLPRVMGNADHLQQAFVNLILNAQQVMKEGGKLHVTTSLAGDYVTVSFRDTGPGIPRKHIRKIFEPFYSTKEAGKGTGLGLFIIHSIMEEHRGKIEVQSKRGQGATFILKLPVGEKKDWFGG